MPNIERQPSLEGMSRRDILERQDPVVLVALKRQMLDRMSSLEADVHLVNDVLDGIGASRFDPGSAYDAMDGTPGNIEHPEDSRWA